MANLVLNQWVNVAGYTVYTGGGASVSFWIDAKLTKQDKATNKSYIDTRLNTTVYGSVGGAGYGFWVTGSNGNYGGGTWWYSNTTTCTGSYSVEHNDDGTKTTTISANAYNNYLGFNISFSGDGVLPKIDRYPQILTAQDFTDEENPTITYTKVMGFQNATLYGCISLDETTDNVPYRELVVEDGQYTFELTNAERNTLRNATPNSNTLPVTFILKTTVGNNNYYSKLQKNMTIVNADPTFTHSEVELNQKVIDVLGSSSATQTVQNVSQLQITITPTAYKGASISSVRITHNDTEPETKTTSPYVFTKNVKGSIFGVVVTDSRNNACADLIGIPAIEYTPVKINSYSLVRQNSTSSNIILNLQATYTQTTFGSTANVPTVKWKLDDGSYTTIPSSAYTIDTTNKTLTISNYTLSNVLPYTSKGYFSIEVSDLLTSAIENDILVIKGIPTFDYGEHDLKVNGDLYVADTTGSNAKNVMSVINGVRNDVNGIVLFEGETKASTISLSDNAENYSMLEFFYQYGDNSQYQTEYTSMACTRVYSPNGKNANLSLFLAGSAGTNIQFYTSIYKINGNELLLTNWYGSGMLNNNSASSASKTANVTITKVVGYKIGNPVEKSLIVDDYNLSTTNAYSCNYVNSLNFSQDNIFSLNERRIGTWIDGKPLYQKTISCGNLPDNSMKNVAHNISNLKRVIEYKGNGYRASDNINFGMPYPAGALAQVITLYVNNTNVVLITGQDRSNVQDVYVTLKYTKTTD